MPGSQIMIPHLSAQFDLVAYAGMRPNSLSKETSLALRIKGPFTARTRQHMFAGARTGNAWGVDSESLNRLHQ